MFGVRCSTFISFFYLIRLAALLARGCSLMKLQFKCWS
ncbi:hypothetical protein D1AOALGA4SA_5353 [Olavius algarvensis Delta 1 endosymbiont]|nr:hypothetical protein D1AOALGA4SA_5353 [Olavius algarvensis Delta 1 endosymbiont]